MRLTPLAAAFAFILPAVAYAGPMQPGLWERTSVATSIVMPGMPPAAIAAMKKPNSIRDCLTPQEAAQGPRQMFNQDKSCRMTRYSMNGGTFDAQLVCRHGGQTTTMTSHGTFTPTSYSGTSRMVATGAHAMQMTMAASGRRIGPCK